MKLCLTFIFLTLFVFVAQDDASAGMFMGKSEDVYAFILLAWVVVCLAPSILNFLLSRRLNLRLSIFISIADIIWSIIYPVAFFLPLIIFENGADRYKSPFCNFCKEIISTIPYFLFVIGSQLILLIFIAIFNKVKKDTLEVE